MLNKRELNVTRVNTVLCSVSGCISHLGLSNRMHFCAKCEQVVDNCSIYHGVLQR